MPAMIARELNAPPLASSWLDVLDNDSQPLPLAIGFTVTMNSANLIVLADNQQPAPEALSLLDYDELRECIARCAVDKFTSVRAMSKGAAVRGRRQRHAGVQLEARPPR